jgi:hypothetical protein
VIIVTGLRSGTSLMLQTLRLLGFPITGYAFHDEFMHKELNPKGYFNLPMSETLGGIKHHEYIGKAVRLGGADLNSTNPKFINKVIWCRRNPEECKKSIMKMLLADYDIIKLEPNNENAEKIYLINTLFTQKFLDKNEIPCLEIYYEEMLLDTKNTINKIKKFVRTDCDIDKAVNNVDKREVVCQQQQ